MRGPFGPLSCTCTSIHARVCACCTCTSIATRACVRMYREAPSWKGTYIDAPWGQNLATFKHKILVGVFLYLTSSSHHSNLVLLLPLAMPLLFCVLNPLIVNALPRWPPLCCCCCIPLYLCCPLLCNPLSMRHSCSLLICPLHTCCTVAGFEEVCNPMLYVFLGGLVVPFFPFQEYFVCATSLVLS